MTEITQNKTKIQKKTMTVLVEISWKNFSANCLAMAMKKDKNKT